LACIRDAFPHQDNTRPKQSYQTTNNNQKNNQKAWADTFISELNDTHIEADLRLRHTPPELSVGEVVRTYRASSRRLFVLGYNATLTHAVEAPRQPKRHFDQIRALTRVNPRVLDAVRRLCADPNNVVVIFSGSEVCMCVCVLLRALLRGCCCGGV
jgi:trehalose 6-phosphate synthase/phosphatase